MSFADGYFSRQKDFHSHFEDEPSQHLRYVVVVPAYREENIIPALDALWETDRPEGHIEALVVINASVNAPQDIKEINFNTLRQIENWRESHRSGKFKVLALNMLLPARDAGVGLARKIGMDEASWRFNKIRNPSGLIISFDADCRCDKNYFTEIEIQCRQYPKANGFNFYFEHPLSGDDMPRRVIDGILQYELHLRYYVEALRYAGFPYAYHTVGSCYAVKADAYVRQGGMNRKKSGEDFYFLQKIFPLGDFFEINTTRVMPSSRPSDRVPFGTGPAVRKFMQQSGNTMLTYHPLLFGFLKSFFDITPRLYNQHAASTGRLLSMLHPVLRDYLNSLNVYAALDEINDNCGSRKSFVKRFYGWFDAFAVLKFLNRASSGEFQRMPVKEATCILLKKKGLELTVLNDPESMLLFLREIEKGQNYISPLQR